MTVVCPICREPFDRRAGGAYVALWDGQGSRGEYFPIEQADWCLPCRLAPPEAATTPRT